MSIPAVNHASEVLVQGKLRDRLLKDIRVKSIELDERKQEASTKLELRKRNYNSQLNDLRDQNQMEEERGNDQMAHMR